MRESRECLECGGIYFRAQNIRQVDWDGRKYCSVGCASKVGLRRMAAKKLDEGLAPEAAEEEAAVAETSLVEPKAPIMRDLRIVRVGPNPRTVTCEYFELAQRRTCTVMVKRNDKFVRGMRLKLAEPAGELEFERPWVYSGAAPRRRGRW